MKKLFKTAVSLIVALSLMFCFALGAAAEGKVTYEGQAKGFIFEPGSEYSPTDLFSKYKGVMPGDSIDDTVLIKNDPDKEVKINLYMRSLGAQENTNEFLSKMTLTVDQVGKSNLFKAPADQKATLEDWVFLGTVYSGGEITLNINLNVPLEVGNDFADQIGYLDWQFKIEELPVEPDDPKPDTGDDTNLVLWVSLFFASIAVVFILILFRKKKKEEEQLVTEVQETVE